MQELHSHAGVGRMSSTCYARVNSRYGAYRCTSAGRFERAERTVCVEHAEMYDADPSIVFAWGWTHITNAKRSDKMTVQDVMSYGPAFTRSQRTTWLLNARLVLNSMPALTQAEAERLSVIEDELREVRDVSLDGEHVLWRGEKG